MKLKVRSLVVLLMCLMILDIPYLSQRINNIITLAIEILITLYFIQNSLNKSMLRKCAPLVLFWLCMIYCTVVNLGFTSRTVNAIVTGYEYFLIFYTVIFISKKSSLQDVINIIWKYVVFIVVVADICVFITKGRGLGMQDAVLGLYVVGNKFTVSYYHMLLISIFLCQSVNNYGNKRKSIFIFLGLYSIFVCYFLSCNTGIVGCIVVMLLCFLNSRKNKILDFLYTPHVFIGIFIGLTFFLIGTDVLLNNQWIYNLLSKYTHTNKILSGRLDMYAIALSAIQKQPWFGYGINCTIVEESLTWGNAQNGLLKMLLDYGVIGTAIFLHVCSSALKNYKYDHNYKMNFPVLAFLYAMMVCSLVEINISGLFFVALALIQGSKLDRNLRTIIDK